MRSKFFDKTVRMDHVSVERIGACPLEPIDTGRTGIHSWILLSQVTGLPN